MRRKLGRVRLECCQPDVRDVTDRKDVRAGLPLNLVAMSSWLMFVNGISQRQADLRTWETRPTLRAGQNREGPSWRASFLATAAQTELTSHIHPHIDTPLDILTTLSHCCKSLRLKPAHNQAHQPHLPSLYQNTATDQSQTCPTQSKALAASRT